MKDPFRITHNFDVSSQAVEELKDDLYEITSDFLDTYGIRPSGLALGPKEFLTAKYSSYFTEANATTPFEIPDEFSYMGYEVHLSATDGVRCLAPKNMAAQLVDPKNWGK